MEAEVSRCKSDYSLQESIVGSLQTCWFVFLQRSPDTAFIYLRIIRHQRDSYVMHRSRQDHAP